MDLEVICSLVIRERGKKVTFSLSTPRKHMEGVEIQVHSFLTSAPERGEWTNARPSRLRKGKDPSIHLVGGWMGPRAGLEIWK